MKSEKINISRITYTNDGVELEGLVLQNHASPGRKSPGVVFIHGHQSSCWLSICLGYALYKKGFNVFIPSQRGYGLSGGRPDFCGPKTVGGVIRGIQHFLRLPFVDKNKLGIWGISRGATVAASVAIQAPALFKAVILQSGAYDLKSHYDSTPIEGIREIIKKEIGISKSAFIKRSPIHKIGKIKAPILILHGKNDERVLVEQAKMLEEKLNQINHSHKTVILDNELHILSKSTRHDYVWPFLNKYLK